MKRRTVIRTKKQLARHLGRFYRWLRNSEIGNTKQEQLTKIHKNDVKIES